MSDYNADEIYQSGYDSGYAAGRESMQSHIGRLRRELSDTKLELDDTIMKIHRLNANVNNPHYVVGRRH